MPDKTSDLRQAWKNACLRIDSLQSNVDKTVMALSKRNIASSFHLAERSHGGILHYNGDKHLSAAPPS